MRILIAGTSSGCGKTTAALAVIAAFRAKGLAVASFKVGPDYIDPGFHQAACGRPSDNLDEHLCDAGTVRAILRAGEEHADIAVIEGVMGYYDGMSSKDFSCSTWSMAHATRTPVLLVIDASGGAASAAATVLGFRRFRRSSHIAGVLVNRVSSRGHYDLVREAVERYAGPPCVGYLPKDSDLALGSRHLGLIPAAEAPELANQLDRAAQLALQTVDLYAILRLAAAAPPLTGDRKPLPDRRDYRLGVARDQAFSFYYEENLRMLQASGMRLSYFSPLQDERLPEGLNGLYIGGGFPEVFAEKLEANRSMRESVRQALEGGLRCYAECGGLMYLSRSIDGRGMAGFFPIVCRMTDRLQRFGYVNVTDRTGLTFPAHEFHHAVAEVQMELPCAFRVVKSSDPNRSWTCGYEKQNALAGFPHLHFASHPELIRRLWP
jgi:cobyrinic acid a,c-diamide synthase